MPDKSKKKTDFDNPAYYINRELSWLQFNRRVLEEAKNKENPLFERLKFLSITASNLDEFVMVRVAALQALSDEGIRRKDAAGLTPKEQLKKVTDELHKFVEDQYHLLSRSVLPGLEDAGVTFADEKHPLTDREAAFADRYFDRDVYPVLTPMAVDASRPFPLVKNGAVYIGALIKDRHAEDIVDLCMVQTPDVLPRILELPSDAKDVRRFILLEELIERNMDKLFLNHDIMCRHKFRVLRSADLDMDGDDVHDLLKEIEAKIKKRRRGKALCLDLPVRTDKRLVKRLEKELSVTGDGRYNVDGPLDLTFLMKLYQTEGFDAYKEHRYHSSYPVPRLKPGTDIFEEIKNGDILMHHPYSSFEPVVRFVEEAASDSNVLAIKQTLYRVSGNSPIIAALARAADAGKQVTVLVELKARFDEENNIGWARMLEQAGCHVIYGLVGLKIHCKITLVIRREESGLRRYVHLGTGNYNDSTARLYTDIGMFTCKETYGADATAVFNMLSGYSQPLTWNRLVTAPYQLKDRLLRLIQREAEHARAGEPAHIIAKMNSLCHPEVISALYGADAAGVKTDLIVRGICSLRPGVKNVSENITVRSIVGNFLEHSRIFYFRNGYEPEIYCSSADWMPRNLERRVEIMFPVEEEELKAQLLNILETELADTEKARIMKEDGFYTAVDKRGKERINSQLVFCGQAVS